jgi:hypothetical protein
MRGKSPCRKNLAKKKEDQSTESENKILSKKYHSRCSLSASNLSHPLSLYVGHPISAMEDGSAWLIINTVFMNVIIQHDNNLLEEEDK